jgi:hypothetical protein
MFFKKALRDSSLIRKLTMKNHMMSEEMLVIANKCALAEDRPSTTETETPRRIRSWVNRIDPTPPKATTRRGSQTALWQT